MVPTLVFERGAFKIGLGGVLGSSLAPFWFLFGALGWSGMTLGRSWGDLGGSLGRLLAAPGRSWAAPGSSWNAPGTLLGALGSPRVDLGAFEGRFGIILGPI